MTSQDLKTYIDSKRLKNSNGVLEWTHKGCRDSSVGKVPAEQAWETEFGLPATL